KRQEHIQRLEEQTVHIQRMLEDLLKMSELDGHNFHYTFEPLNIIGLIQGVIRDFEPLAATQEHRLIFQPDRQNIIVNGDVTYLRRMISNLLENAIRYTDRGGTITVYTEHSDTALDILVEDTGIGISEHDQQHIFEYFFRADQARSIDTGGTG